jgi:hypothetical protein
MDIVYLHYLKWLRNNTELQIGANYLTNEQLFWVAYAVTKYTKYHKIVPKRVHTDQRLKYEYFHVQFKASRGFRTAFRCNVTDEEVAVLKEYEEQKEAVENKI